jgi:hypothetical protein|tara:strand:+ start:393 stop:623 length:231 start_codon:yes stop_codon:yes gene_type:complete
MPLPLVSLVPIASTALLLARFLRFLLVLRRRATLLPSSPVVVVLTRIVSAAGTVAPPLDSLALVRRVRRVQRLHVG